MVTPASRLGNQISQVVTELNAAELPFALIGGLALAAHRVVRATSDLDLLVRQEDQAAISALAAKLGYRCLHQSADAANFVRADERLDVLFASRPAATRLLREAGKRQTTFGELRVVSAEGLIGLELQAVTNNPRRTRDLEDIRELLRVNRGSLDLAEIRGYFKLFDRRHSSMNSLPRPEDPVSAPAPYEPPTEAVDPFVALDELMVVVESLCPHWPEKEPSRTTVGYLL